MGLQHPPTWAQSDLTMLMNEVVCVLLPMSTGGQRARCVNDGQDRPQARVRDVLRCASLCCRQHGCHTSHPALHLGVQEEAWGKTFYCVHMGRLEGTLGIFRMCIEGKKAGTVILWLGRLYGDGAS